MPYFRTPFTINNGDTASAQYLTNMVQVSSYASSATVLIGNSTTATAQPLVEITIGSNLALSTASVLSVTSAFAVTGTMAATGAATFYSTVSVTGAMTALSTVAVTGAADFYGLTTLHGSGSVTGSLTVVGTAVLSTVTITTPLPVASGGTAAGTVAAANQGLTPGFVNYASPGSTQTVNWASGAAFYITLNAGLTVSFSNAVDGQVITILILNTASNYTVTWPGTVKWPGNAPPTQTIGAHYDLYCFEYNSAVGAYFGTFSQNY